MNTIYNSSLASLASLVISYFFINNLCPSTSAQETTEESAAGNGSFCGCLVEDQLLAQLARLRGNHEQLLRDHVTLLSRVDNMYSLFDRLEASTEQRFVSVSEAVKRLEDRLPPKSQSISPTANPPTPVLIGCPSGFHGPTDKICYMIVTENMTWAEGQRRCQTIQPGTTLAIVLNKRQNNAIVSLITSQMRSSCVLDYETGPAGPPIEAYNVAGQRIVENNCSSGFAWKPDSSTRLAFNYTNWWTGEPNCNENKESCVQYRRVDNVTRLNDISCEYKYCFVCQYSLPQPV